MSSDPHGLLSILETHGAELHALFTRITMRATVAEDLLQDLFLKLRNSEGFARADNPKAYAFQTAIHLAFDWRRAQRPTESLTVEPPDRSDCPLDHLVDAEQMEQVLEAMKELSDLNRQVIVLRYLQSQDYADIAKQLGRTEHQVRALCHKAIGQLKSTLRPAADKPDS